jgi:hypothetical protein
MFLRSDIVSRRIVVLTLIANLVAPSSPPAQACLNSWTRYYSTLSSLASKSYTTTLTSTEIFSTYPAIPTSTFCDNIPRLLGRQYSAYVTEWYPTATYTTWSSMTSPTPICTVDGNDCEKLQSSWTIAHTTETPIPDFPVPCTTYRACSSVSAGPCSLVGSSVKIYYWPTPATQPLCSPTNTLLSTSRPTLEAATSKSPVVKVIDGLTVTSPSIYISIPTLYGQFRGAPTNLFTGCGSQLTSLTLSIPPSPISTLTRQTRGRRPTYENPKPFALSTLNWPVSATQICSEITTCKWNDAISTCTDVLGTRCATPTINPYDYNPALLLPTDLAKQAAKKEASYQSCVVSCIDTP